jgi:CspA family cold shock protein
VQRRRQSSAERRQFNEASEGNAEMAEGTIKKLTDKGFGFIKAGGEKDLFFHSKSVQGCSFEDLEEGQKVSFTEGKGPKGPVAENVKPV